METMYDFIEELERIGFIITNEQKVSLLEVSFERGRTESEIETEIFSILNEGLDMSDINQVNAIIQAKLRRKKNGK